MKGREVLTDNVCLFTKNTLPGTPQNETLKTKPKNKLGVSKNEKRNSKNKAVKQLGVSKS